MSSLNHTSRRRISALLSQLRVCDNGDNLQLNACSGDMYTPSQAADGPLMLEKERERSSFDARQLTHYLDGSEQYTYLKEIVAAQIETDEVLNDAHTRAHQSVDEARITTMKKILHIAMMWKTMKKTTEQATNTGPDDDQEKSPQGARGKTLSDAFWEVMSAFDPSWSIRLGVHVGLFGGTVQGQGSPEQLAKHRWAEDAATFKIYGCFAMTELGTGSAVRNIQTTSTYDATTEEFVLDSPSLLSTKWWIGGLAETATHAVVFARLLLGGDDHGPHPFVVPLRDRITGLPLEGREIGDVGVKFGRQGIDNGYLRFHSVRIPRDHMLMRFNSVSKEGVYTRQAKRQISYGALVAGRVSIVADSASYMKRAVTIAIRYAAVRTQFKTSPILDYMTHQHRLLPILAGAYALHFSSARMGDQYTEMAHQSTTNADFSLLPETHATSAGLKAYSTWWANESLEICRQSLGGHGYSEYGGIAAMLRDFVVNCTWEGDNTVMALQAGRFLMSQRQKANEGKTLSGFTQYIGEGDELLRSKSTIESSSDFDLTTVLQLHKFVAATLVAQCGASLDVLEEDGYSREEALEQCAVELLRCTKTHVYYYMLSCFATSCAVAPNDDVRQVLEKLCLLFGLWTLTHGIPSIDVLLGNGMMTHEQTKAIHVRLTQLYHSIRSEAVSLVDAFNLPDFILSPLGRKDGRLYEEYFKTVQTAESARGPDVVRGKASYWDQLIKPLVTAD
eukprot:TRINITY_DN5211_c0_g1_i1.p1 TRINITY_DN5211_c0_g1~~TRINITY_DN5211_c0_g1_i1.p1  ORF type:complete len:732 (+),score=145.99 TRINITY_DN5211_c0_g1_i1:63-2258(+)